MAYDACTHRITSPKGADISSRENHPDSHSFRGGLFVKDGGARRTDMQSSKAKTQWGFPLLETDDVERLRASPRGRRERML